MRATTRVAILAILAVLALSLAAATLDSTVTPERSGPSGWDGGDAGGGDRVPVTPSGPSPAETVGTAAPTGVLLVLFGVLVAASLAALYRYRRGTFRVALVLVVLVGAWAVLFQFASPSVPMPGAPTTGTENGSFLGGGGGGPTESTSPSMPSLLSTLVVGALLVGAVAVLFRRRSDGDDEGDDEPDPDPDAEVTDAAAVGRAAGRAADRLDGEADVENEVYRAWREMTGLLDVDRPESTTPRQFADAAVAAGLASEDVSELTRLFEDVRYGDATPTEADERTALAVFRRIETQYAEADS